MIAIALAAVMQAPAAPQADTKLYRLMQRGMEVGRESYRRTPGVIERTVTIPLLNLKLETTVHLEAGRVSRYTGRVQNAAADTVRLDFTGVAAGDSIVINSAAGEQRRSRVARVRPEGFIPAQSVSVIAEAAARAAGRDTVFRYMPMGIDSTIPVTVRHTRDAISVEMAGVVAFIAGQDGTIRIPVSALEAVVWNGVDSLPPLRGMRPPALSYDAPAGASYTAEHVRVTIRPAEGDTFSLAATLSLPLRGPRPFPAVVMMSGSGQQDRDENLWPLMTDYRPFRQYAERLAREGIAVLRYDDRTAGESGGNVGGTTADYTDDVRQLVAWLRARPEIDASRVGLVGHSEGGVMGPLLASQDPRLKAVVVMAGPSKNGRLVVRDQFVRPIETAVGLSPADRARMLAQVDSQVGAWLNMNPWSRWFGTHEPLETARRLRMPVLIQHGELDRQVTVGQADSLATAIRAGGNRDVTVKIYPRMNHLFLVTDGDGSPSEYGALRNQLVPDEVMDDMAEWLARKLRM